MADDNNRTGDATAESEDETLSLREVIATNRRIQDDPDSVSDEELREHFGADIDVKEIRGLFRRSTFGHTAKNQRASARAKLKRRMLWLHKSIIEVEAAIKEVVAAPGRTNKVDELVKLQEALADFRVKAGLTDDGVLDQEVDPDLFERLFGEIGR
jgi:hypothetical protein